MNYPQAIQLAQEVLRLAGCEEPEGSGIHWRTSDYFHKVAYAATQIPLSARPPWLLDWARSWRELLSDFEALRARDPMLNYRPAHHTAEEFHKSLAYIRRFYGSNRSGKTTAGYAEDYWCATGTHPWRDKAWPGSVLLVAGLPFSDYVAKTFEKKLISGEDGPDGGKNPLSPMFPEGGAWLYRYDKRDHIVYLACPECKAKGQPGSCPGHHKKTTIALATSEKGIGVIESFTVKLAHGDEHLPAEFLGAMKQRVGDQSGSLIFTGTPLAGPRAWEETDLSEIARGPDRLNHKDLDNPESQKYCTIHHISKWDAGIVPHEQIKAEMQGMPASEIKARIEGLPAALASNPVFDLDKLNLLSLKSIKPRRGILCPVQDNQVENSGPRDLNITCETKHLNFVEQAAGPLRVWEVPEHGAQYIIGGDTAAGLSKKHDPSCGTVLKLCLVDGRVAFKQVAQYHDWLGVHEYADELYKLAVWYNSALLIVELTGGLGRAVVERLKKDLCYWNLFRDSTKGEFATFGQDARFGVDTSMVSKPSMLGVLQQIIKDDRLLVYCADTIEELVAYEQQITEKGNSTYCGAAGMHDDRVMALAIAVSVAISHAIFDLQTEMAKMTAMEKGRESFFAQVDKEQAEQRKASEWSGYL